MRFQVWGSATRKKLGAEIVAVPNEKVQEAMKAIDAKAAEAEAQEYWISQAKEIVEPKAPEIIESARLYLAVKNLMIDERSCSIPVGLRSGLAPGYNRGGS